MQLSSHSSVATPVLNLMLGAQRGGLEQAAIDYAQALAAASIGTLTVIAPNAWVEAPLVAAGLAHQSLANHGQWDILAAWRLRALAKKTQARVIICHGNRAVSLALRALKGRIPIIAVTHNYSTRRFKKADGCFAITEHLAAHATRMGAQIIATIPNMTRHQATIPRSAFRSPPVIGAMGRFGAKKGFQTYIEALSVLRARGVAFHALLGGDGEDAAKIDALIARYQLQSCVTRTGWVKDKSAFFAALDIFVLPSNEEAFGIVLIEAMSRALPVISTDAPGPRCILHSGVDGLLVPRKNPEALADAIAVLLNDPSHATALGKAGARLVASEYSLERMAQRLQTALAPYI
jgi:glycosyltransferase involved in cell wall biosynthesis